MLTNPTPIGRPESRTKAIPCNAICVATKYELLTTHTLVHLRSVCVAPGFSLCQLRPKSRQTPVGIKRVAIDGDCLGGRCRPRETLAPKYIQMRSSHSTWLSRLRRQFLGGSQLGRFRIQSEGTKTASNHSRWLKASQVTGPPSFAKPLRKATMHIKGLLFPQDVETRPRQFMR